MKYPPKFFLEDINNFPIKYMFIELSNETEISSAIYILLKYIRKLEKRVSILEGNNDDNNHYGRKLEPLPEPNPLIGKWVKCIMDSEFCTGNTWYMINDKGVINDRIYVCNPDKHTSFILSKDYFNLTDIRDYNPDEEIVLKVGDKI